MTDQLTLAQAEIDEMDAGSIPVGEQHRELHHYTATGSVVSLGTVITRNYRGEQAQRHFFHANKAEEGRSQKVYKLGVTTSQFRFVDHTVALDPLLNRGYQIKDTIISRGGMNMYAVLEKPNARPMTDPMNWDIQFWHDGSGQGLRQVPRELHESIVAFSSIRPGKGIKYSRGWFRLICSNGLVAEILKLGSVMMNHNNWNAPLLTQKLNILPALDESNIIEMGPVAGGKNGVQRFAALLDQFGTLPADETADPDDGSVGPSIEAAVRDLPLFIQDEVTTFLTMPIWFRQALTEQFRALADGSAKDQKIHVLDVVNAVTNPINLERFIPRENPRSVLRPLMRSNSMITSATKLIGAFSLS